MSGLYQHSESTKLQQKVWKLDKAVVIPLDSKLRLETRESHPVCINSTHHSHTHIIRVKRRSCYMTGSAVFAYHQLHEFCVQPIPPYATLLLRADDISCLVRAIIATMLPTLTVIVVHSHKCTFETFCDILGLVRAPGKATRAVS
jgi:hypothetical protein